MLVERLLKHLQEHKEPRFRDRRGHYASGLTSDMRDLYWAATGEKETNPTDVVGKMKMNCGSWIEAGLVKDLLSKLHMYGLHMLSDPNKQTPIGSSDPDVDGYVDGLLVERRGDEFSKRPWVLEIKTKYGFGTTMFKKDPRSGEAYNPGDGYLAQLGYYLKDLQKKGITDRGLFLFVLLGDDCFAEVVEILVKYVVETDEVVAFQYQEMGFGKGENPPVVKVDYRIKLQPYLDRLIALDGYIARKELPPQDKQYKYPVTAESVEALSDYSLDLARKGVKVLGDWEIIYSRFKAKHLELQGGPGYNAAEQAILDEEFKRRAPARAAKRAKGKAGKGFSEVVLKTVQRELRSTGSED